MESEGGEKSMEPRSEMPKDMLFLLGWMLRKPSHTQSRAAIVFQVPRERSDVERRRQPRSESVLGASSPQCTEGTVKAAATAELRADSDS